MTGPFQKTGKSGRQRRSHRTPHQASKLDLSTVQVKCSFCGNTFYSRPKTAVCPKCQRPANRDLPRLWRAISLLLPPLGLGYALSIRAHSPVAALQGLKWSLSGALVLIAIAVVRALG